MLLQLSTAILLYRAVMTQKFSGSTSEGKKKKNKKKISLVYNRVSTLIVVSTVNS